MPSDFQRDSNVLPSAHRLTISHSDGVALASQEDVDTPLCRWRKRGSEVRLCHTGSPPQAGKGTPTSTQEHRCNGFSEKLPYVRNLIPSVLSTSPFQTFSEAHQPRTGSLALMTCSLLGKPSLAPPTNQRHLRSETVCPSSLLPPSSPLADAHSMHLCQG